MMIDTAPQKKESNPQPPTTKRQPNRRERRAAFKNLFPKRNDGKFKGTGNRQMMAVWNDKAIYIPRRKKLKGYQKNAKRA